MAIVSYWKFDTDNATQPDSVAANDGTVSGATYNVNGIIDDSYTYDGTNDKITIAGAGLDGWLSGDFSVSVWIKPDSAGAGNNMFISKRDPADTNLGIFMSYNHPDSLVYCQIDLGASVKYVTLAGITEDAWNHIVFIRSGTTLTPYLNSTAGTPDTTAGNDADVSNTHTMRFGVDEGATNWFKGDIDECAIYDNAINQTTIDSLYNSGDGFQYPFTEPVITVTAHNGGDDLTVGVETNVTWTSTSGSPPKDFTTVEIEVSLNNGDTYNDIIDPTPDDGTYAWTPANPSTEALIRIADPADATVNDVSDATFTITAPGEPQDADRAGYSRGEKELKTNWPITSGLTAKTQKQTGRKENLIPERGSNVLKRNRMGI